MSDWPLPPFRLERFFARWEFSVAHVLGASDVEPLPMRDLLALADPDALCLWERLTLGYTESGGLPLLRAEIASLYTDLSADDILCFAGAEEAIYVAIRVLVGRGERVVVTWPGYQSLFEVARAAGAEVVPVPLELADTPAGPVWRLDPDRLRVAVEPGTRLIVTNFPHNPTGALPTREEWAEVVEIARRAGSHLLSDEVYRLLEPDPADRLPPAADLHERAVSVGVMSKPFGLAGLRIGWLASRDRTFLERAAAYKDYTSICNSAPSEILALIALRARDRLLTRAWTLIQANRGLWEGFQNRHSHWLDWVPPQAGSVAFPAWRGPLPVDELAERLAREVGVLILPGSLFDHPGGNFRLGLGRSGLADALARLDSFLNQLAGR